MVLAGGLAGFIGFHEVFSCQYRLIDAFSSGFGFTGLAIALLVGRSSGLTAFLKLFLWAFILGALHKGALDLDIETQKITRDLSLVIQAVILFALAAGGNKK
jgi:simple sugar transport system permease protein